MKRSFNIIEEFFNIKEKCIFCDSDLKLVLTNFIGLNENDLPLINSVLEDGYFNFTIDYFSKMISVFAKFSLDPKTNLMKFDLGGESALNTNYIKTTFENFKPHLELYCAKKSCAKKYNYSIFSDVLKCEMTKEKNEFIIKPFLLYSESFNLDNYWIQNDWANNKLHIFSKENIDTEPLSYELLDFGMYEKEILINKIRTFVTFS